MTTVQQAKELRDTIRQHDHLYYNIHQPRISDQEYDLLFSQLKDIEARSSHPPSPDSPTQRVGGTVSSTFQTVHHEPTMLSLGNTADITDFRDWYERTNRSLNYSGIPMTAELKIDGLAISMDYVDGELVLAATRGDGQNGEDVTHNIRTIRNLPLRLLTPFPGLLRVRGEAYFPLEAFRDINEQREECGEYLYANPRNAAAGTVRQLDPTVASERNLRVWVYSLSHADAGTNESHWRNLDLLTKAGLPINPRRVQAHSVQDVIEYYQAMLDVRHQLEYEADGIVVKVDDRAMQQRLGSTGHEPRWAIAWKFPSSQATTRLESISISLGRFGKLTPVAELAPVAIEGTTIRHASLHNEDDILRKDIRAGEDVLIERAGGVIPQVVGPINTNPDRPTPRFRMPEYCPECSSQIQRDADHAAHWCVNPSCTPRLLEVLKHFVSKDALDIDGMGPVICKSLISSGTVTNPGQILSLSVSDIASLDRMGAKSAQRIHQNIQAALSRPLDRFLYALGIFRLGHYVSRRLGESCRSIDEVLHLTHQQLIRMEGISDKIAESVLAGLASQRTQDIIQSMRDAGAILHQQENDNLMSTTDSKTKPVFTGLNICVTGTLPGMTRADANTVIRSLLGTPESDVTKKTNILVTGEKTASKSKIAKAKQNGIPVWDGPKFFAMIAQAQEQGQDEAEDERPDDSPPKISDSPPAAEPATAPTQPVPAQGKPMAPSLF